MNKILLIGIALMFSFSNVPSMGQTALIGAEVPISPSKTLPEPAMVYQYGGKDNHKDREAFNKHLNEIRSTAVLLNQWGWYNRASDEVYSRSKNLTNHEQAHRFDAMVFGSPSTHNKFRQEADKIPGIQNVFSKLHRQVAKGAGYYPELYATLWEIAEGNIDNIPQSLKIFYTSEWDK